TIYTVIGLNSAGCAETKTIDIEVITFSLAAEISESVICIGEDVTMTADGADSYTWMPLMQTGSLVSVSPAANTMYSVHASYRGCPGNTTLQVIVSDCPKMA